MNGYLLGTSIQVEWLVHVVCISSAFTDAAKSIFKVIVAICTLQKCMRVLAVPHPCQHDVFHLFYVSHPSSYKWLLVSIKLSMV